MEHTRLSRGATCRLLIEIGRLKGGLLVKRVVSWIKAKLPGEGVSWLSACHQPIGHACVRHRQVYKYVSCFTPHVRGDDNPDGILNAAFHVVSFSRLVHPSLVCHLVPSQPVKGALTLECRRSWFFCLSIANSLHHTQHIHATQLNFLEKFVFSNTILGQIYSFLVVVHSARK